MCLVTYTLCDNHKLLDNINKVCLLTHYSFTRVQFALVGQENQDANLGEDNYIFFLSGTEIGKAARFEYGNPIVSR